MARIPVERERKGSPWWLWLLGLLLLAGLIWLLADLFSPDRPADEVVEGEVEEVEPTTPAEGAVITDPMQIVNAREPASMVGRPVELENMRVVAVQGDSIFVVEPMAAMAGDTAAVTRGTQARNQTDTSDTSAAESGAMDQRLLVVREMMGARGGRDTMRTSPDTQNGNMADISAGETVRISGTIQEIDEAMMQDLNIPGIDTDELTQSGLYVQAEEITPTNENAGRSADTTR